MTTNSFSSAISMATDADFRTAHGQVRAGLTAVGLVQTANTGQLNPATMVRAGANGTAAGYEIWRFNDSLQATAPIFIKIEPGRGNSITGLSYWITIGSGTDGAGTITGVASSRQVCNAPSTPSGGSFPSYFCHTEGFLGVNFKLGSYNSATNVGGPFSCAVCRTCDASGVPTGDGAVMYAGNRGNPAIVQALNFLTATVFAANGSGQYAVIAHEISDTTVGADKQVFLHVMPNPKTVPVFGLISCLQSEYAIGTSVTVAMVGTTPRVYLVVGNSMGYGISGSSSTYSAMGMLWE